MNRSGRSGSRVVGLTIILVLAFSILMGCQSQPAPAPTKATAPSTAPAAVPAQPTRPPAVATQAPAAPASTQAAATPAAASPPETLKVGISEPLTGAAARLGMIAERLERMGIDDINAKGGVKVGNKSYRIEAVTVDDKNTSDGGRDAANRLVLAEKVKIILGTFSTPLAGAQPITEPNKVLTIAANANDRSLTPQMPLTYQVVSSNPMRSVALYDWLVKEHPEVKRVALIDGDDATGRGNVEAAERNIKERGLTLAHKEFYPVDMKDFEPLVTRLLRERPDVIDIAAGAARTAMFLAVPKALSNQGFKGFLIATSVDETVMRQYAAVMEGLTVPMMIDPRAPVVTAGERDIAERYINKYSLAEFQGSTMVLYTAPLVLAQALEKAGTVDDTAKIAQVMSTAQFDLPYGKSRFAGTKTWGRPALMEQPIYMSGIRNGKAGTFASQWGTIP